MESKQSNIARLRRFVVQMTELVERANGSEQVILNEGRDYLKQLVAEDDWLPEFCAAPHPEFYQQYLLHCDPYERFSIVSFVWGAGQTTPVHDHTVWGLIGMLRGAESEEQYEYTDGRLMVRGVNRLDPGEVGAVSPDIGDVHKVSNAYDDRVSISIHVYGSNIGKVARHVLFPDTGEAKNFVSGYVNDTMPNIWYGNE